MPFRVGIGACDDSLYRVSTRFDDEFGRVVADRFSDSRIRVTAKDARNYGSRVRDLILFPFARTGRNRYENTLV